MCRNVLYVLHARLMCMLISCLLLARCTHLHRTIVLTYIVLRFKDSEHSTAEMLTLTCPLLHVRALREKKARQAVSVRHHCKRLKSRRWCHRWKRFEKNALGSCILYTNFLYLNALETVYSKAVIVKASLPLERIVKACRPLERI